MFPKIAIYVLIRKIRDLYGCCQIDLFVTVGQFLFHHIADVGVMTKTSLKTLRLEQQKEGIILHEDPHLLCA